MSDGLLGDANTEPFEEALWSFLNGANQALAVYENALYSTERLIDLKPRHGSGCRHSLYMARADLIRLSGEARDELKRAAARYDTFVEPSKGGSQSSTEIHTLIRIMRDSAKWYECLEERRDDVEKTLWYVE